MIQNQLYSIANELQFEIISFNDLPYPYSSWKIDLSKKGKYYEIKFDGKLHNMFFKSKEISTNKEILKLSISDSELKTLGINKLEQYKLWLQTYSDA